MNIYRYKVDDSVDVNRLFSLYRNGGYKISNPDCKKGESFDVIIRGGQWIAGFDLLMTNIPPKGLLKQDNNGIISERAGRTFQSELGSGIWGYNNN